MSALIVLRVQLEEKYGKRGAAPERFASKISAATKQCLKMKMILRREGGGGEGGCCVFIFSCGVLQPRQSFRESSMNVHETTVCLRKQCYNTARLTKRLGKLVEVAPTVQLVELLQGRQWCE